MFYPGTRIFVQAVQASSMELKSAQIFNRKNHPPSTRLRLKFTLKKLITRHKSAAVVLPGQSFKENCANSFRLPS
jgi:hypothetical protein